MAADMRFTPEAMQRGFEALADFQKHICAYNCCKVRAVATAACRMAGNGMDFVRRVAEQCGLQLEVIDGAEEARLNLKGAVMNSKGLAPYVVVYDLGGGSTEITLATNDAEQKFFIRFPFLGGRGMRRKLLGWRTFMTRSARKSCARS